MAYVMWISALVWISQKEITDLLHDVLYCIPEERKSESGFRLDQLNCLVVWVIEQFVAGLFFNLLKKLAAFPLYFKPFHIWFGHQDIFSLLGNVAIGDFGDFHRIVHHSFINSFTPRKNSKPVHLDLYTRRTRLSSVQLRLWHILLSECHRVVCGAFRLLAPWATRLLSQWMLQWWRVSGSAAREPFSCTHLLRPSMSLELWTGRKYLFSSLKRYNPTGIPTQPTSFGGACSTNCTS